MSPAVTECRAPVALAQCGIALAKDNKNNKKRTSVGKPKDSPPANRCGGGEHVIESASMCPFVGCPASQQGRRACGAGAPLFCFLCTSIQRQVRGACKGCILGTDSVNCEGAVRVQQKSPPTAALNCRYSQKTSSPPLSCIAHRLRLCVSSTPTPLSLLYPSPSHTHTHAHTRHLSSSVSLKREKKNEHAQRSAKHCLIPRTPPPPRCRRLHTFPNFLFPLELRACLSPPPSLSSPVAAAARRRHACAKHHVASVTAAPRPCLTHHAAPPQKEAQQTRNGIRCC